MSNGNIKNCQILEKDGVLTGPFRQPVNSALNKEGSIHHNETAQSLGLRGGTVAGSIHLEQFVPLLMEAFGERWFETGGISMYFRNATTHLEPVQCFIQKPLPGDDVQAEIWINHENGMLVGEGTASIGSPAQQSALRRKVNNLHPPGEVRIYKNISPGMEIPGVDVNIPLEDVRKGMETITEPLDWYVGDSPWGGPVLTPELMVRVFMLGLWAHQSRSDTSEVGLYGALEFRYINGPVFADHDYVLSGKFLAVGETPKTEYIWHESVLSEADTGNQIAEALSMTRIMKASSSLYPELRREL